ncbi:MAG TPA: hypothetical protein VFK31_01330 [Rhodanobacteraceae bacterium]|nr:hypothetical protein [Rhodanobacteraceae bacterium]
MSEEAPKPADPEPRRRMRWLRREAINLGDFVVQIFAVVLGILLALFIDNRATEHQQQNAVDDAMHSIQAELVANRAALHDSVAYLYRRAARMQKAPENQNQPPRPCYLWSQWGGTGAVNLTDAAYQTAIATQALSHMPFKQAQQIAQVYGKQRITRKSFSLIRTNILIAGPHSLDLCVSAIRNFAANERHIANAYDPLIGPDNTEWPTPPSQPTSLKNLK